MVLWLVRSGLMSHVDRMQTFLTSKQIILIIVSKLVWACDLIEMPLLGRQLTSKNAWPKWAQNLSPNMLKWYCSADTSIWQVSMDHKSNIKDVRCKPWPHALLPIVRPPCWTIPRRRACAPMSNTASHFYHANSSSRVSIEYGDPS